VTGWVVQVGEVKGVIMRTAAAAKPLRAHAKSLGTELNQAYGAVQIGVMASALQGFAEHVAQVLPDVADEVNAVLTGAAKATRAIDAERGVAHAVGLQQPGHRISPRADGK
jgi:Family of unknown function (DUF6507)